MTGALRLVCALVYLFLLAPIVVVVVASFNAGGFLTFPPQGLSFRWYDAFFHNRVFLTAILTSLRIAAVATVISGVVGTAAATFQVRHAGRWAEPLRIAMLSPLLLPEVLSAIALLFFFYTLGLGTRGGVALVAGHVLVTLPFVFMNVTASLHAFDRNWERAAQSLGARPWTVFRRVTLPLIKPGIISGCLFAFIISFDTFSMSLLLKDVGSATLPLQLFDYLRLNFTPEAAAVSSVSVGLTLVVVVLTEWFVGLRATRF